jgi:hypothetical protein
MVLLGGVLTQWITADSQRCIKLLALGLCVLMAPVLFLCRYWLMVAQALIIAPAAFPAAFARLFQAQLALLMRSLPPCLLLVGIGWFVGFQIQKLNASPHRQAEQTERRDRVPVDSRTSKARHR